MSCLCQFLIWRIWWSHKMYRKWPIFFYLLVILPETRFLFLPQILVNITSDPIKLCILLCGGNLKFWFRFLNFIKQLIIYPYFHFSFMHYFLGIFLICWQFHKYFAKIFIVHIHCDLLSKRSVSGLISYTFSLMYHK